MNIGLNEVLATLPQDPFSQMAATLIDSVQRPPIFERFEASETLLNEALQTIKVDVFLQYQGHVKKSFSYLVPLNQEEYDDPDYMFDDGETKSGFKNACAFINSQMTQFF